MDMHEEKHFDSLCCFCSMQCGLDVKKENKDGKELLSTTALKKSKVSKGLLCVKGMNAYQQLTSSDRIIAPLKKVNGAFIPTTWEDAYSIIKRKLTFIRENHGKSSVAVYGGSSLTNEECYLFGKFARVGLQTPLVDYNGRYCMSSGATAQNKAFGIDRGLNMSLENYVTSDCIFLVGTNIAECQPVMMQYLNAAKKNGAKVIVADIRESNTAKAGHQFLKLKPGSDIVLANAFVKVFIEENLIDEAFINKRTNGFEELKKHVTSLTFAEIEELTDLTESEIREAAKIFGEAKNAILLTGRGAEMQENGINNVLSYINVSLVSGKIGREGSGFGIITGQANGQGGREHGQKSDQLPGYRSIENQEHREYVSKVWGIDEKELPHKGTSAYEMLTSVIDGDVKALMVMATNPVVSSPNRDFVRKNLEALDFLFVIDIFMSETAKLADIILPGTMWNENNGTKTNLEGRVQHTAASTEVNFGVNGPKSEVEIMHDIAAMFGKEKYFEYNTSEEIFDELCIASKGGRADYSGMSYKKIQDNSGLFWPCKEGEDGLELMFKDGFNFDDKKAKIFTVKYENPNEVINSEFPFCLTTGRVMSQYLTGVQTHRSPNLDRMCPDNYIEINTEVAAEKGIETGDEVRVTSRYGTNTIKAKVTPIIREDSLFVPIHFEGDKCIANVLCDNLEPTCKMPSFKRTAVQIEAIA